MRRLKPVLGTAISTGTVEELDRQLTKDDLMLAGDAVRAFEKSPAWLILQRELEDLRRRQEKLLYGSTDKVETIGTGYVMGAVQTIENVYRIFDSILSEAVKLREQS